MPIKLTDVYRWQIDAHSFCSVADLQSLKAAFLKVYLKILFVI